LVQAKTGKRIKREKGEIPPGTFFDSSYGQFPKRKGRCGVQTGHERRKYFNVEPSIFVRGCAEGRQDHGKARRCGGEKSTKKHFAHLRGACTPFQVRITR